MLSWGWPFSRTTHPPPSACLCLPIGRVSQSRDPSPILWSVSPCSCLIILLNDTHPSPRLLQSLIVPGKSPTRKKSGPFGSRRSSAIGIENIQEVQEKRWGGGCGWVSSPTPHRPASRAHLGFLEATIVRRALKAATDGLVPGSEPKSSPLPSNQPGFGGKPWAWSPQPQPPSAPALVLKPHLSCRESPTGTAKTPDDNHTMGQEPHSENSSNQSSPEMPTTKNRWAPTSPPPLPEHLLCF